MASGEQHPMAGMSIISVWNLFFPEYPVHFRAAEGEITCACFGFDQTSIIVAGSKDGNIFAWSLRGSRPKNTKKVTSSSLQLKITFFFCLV